jgi:hypothetical protein
MGTKLTKLQPQCIGIYNAKNPERGGCKKDSGGKDRQALRNDLIEKRALCAELQNRHLEKNGFETRVDHRSNHERGIQSKPERHLGSARIKQMDADQLQEFRDRRSGVSS